MPKPENLMPNLEAKFWTIVTAFWTIEDMADRTRSAYIQRNLRSVPGKTSRTKFLKTQEGPEKTQNFEP